MTGPAKPQPPFIRPARLEDAPTIARIIYDLGWWPEIVNQPVDLVAAKVGDRLSRCLADDNQSILGIDDGTGGLLGYASVHWRWYMFLEGREGYVSELFVRADVRGRGLGRMLLRAVEAEAVKRDCRRLLLINGRKKESYRRRFYAKHGWREMTGVAAFQRPLSGC